jgi:hypothetical protein
MKKATKTAPVKKAVTKKVTKKKVVVKTTKKATKAAPAKITMTYKQAQTLQKALGNKSYAFLNKKLSEVSNG